MNLLPNLKLHVYLSWTPTLSYVCKNKMNGYNNSKISHYCIRNTSTSELAHGPSRIACHLYTRRSQTQQAGEFCTWRGGLCDTWLWRPYCISRGPALHGGILYLPYGKGRVENDWEELSIVSLQMRSPTLKPATREPSARYWNFIILFKFLLLYKTQSCS